MERLPNLGRLEEYIEAAGGGKPIQNAHILHRQSLGPHNDTKYGLR